MISTEQTSKPKTCSLHAIARDKTTLQDSLNACQSVWNMEGAIALLYSPRSCQFARIVQGEAQILLMNPENQPIDLPDVFEARVFNSEAELRWLNQFNGRGRTVLLSDNPISDEQRTAIGYDSVDLLTDLETLPQNYLLWGEGWKKPDKENWDNKWSRLTLARIGSLPVPISGVERKQTVVLKAQEYLQADDYGNVSVVEERLLGLEIQK